MDKWAYTTKDVTPKWMLQIFFKKGKNYFIKNKMLTTTAYRVCGVLLTYANKDWPGK